MPIAFEIQQGLPCVFTNLPNLLIIPLFDHHSGKILLWYLKSKCFRSFLGRIEDDKNTFRN